MFIFMEIIKVCLELLIPFIFKLCFWALDTVVKHYLKRHLTGMADITWLCGDSLFPGQGVGQGICGPLDCPGL